MFHVIPISSELTISATPLGARSIRHIFFENKNDGLFRFKSDPDTISISIDGKQVCRDLLVQPFCTSSPCSPDILPWRKVALEVNVNCNLSEVRVQSSAIGDFNVVMVCSAEGVDESHGFDFFETKQVTLRKSANRGVILQALKQAFSKARVAASSASPDGNASSAPRELRSSDVPVIWGNYLQKEHADVTWPASLAAGVSLCLFTKDCSADWRKAATIVDKFCSLFQLGHSTSFVTAVNGVPQFRHSVTGTPKATKDNVKYLGDEWSGATIKDSASFSVRIDGKDYSTGEYCKDKNIEGTEVKEADLGKMATWVQGKAIYNADFFTQENVFSFDREPKVMFVYNVSRVRSPKTDDDDVWLHCDYPLTFTLSGAGHEITEPDTDLALFTANDRIPMRDALLTFDDEDGVTRSISVNVNRRKTDRGVDISTTKHPVAFADWVLYFLFGYKKIV